MFQFPGCPLHHYGFIMQWPGIAPAGFPHSDISGSTLACSSPKLFAACRVLRRRLAPWHPPCALCSLIFSSLLLRPFSTLRMFALSPSALPSGPLPVPWAPIPVATGLFRISSLSVQLSRCAANPDNDTGFLPQESASSSFAGPTPSVSRLALFCASLRSLRLPAYAFRFLLRSTCSPRLGFPRLRSLERR